MSVLEWPFAGVKISYIVLYGVHTSLIAPFLFRRPRVSLSKASHFLSWESRTDYSVELFVCIEEEMSSVLEKIDIFLLLNVVVARSLFRMMRRIADAISL